MWPQAKRDSNLPTPNAVQDIIGLGGGDAERFATEMLANAGINVELVSDPQPEAVRFDFLQIVCEDEAQERFEQAPQLLRLANKADMLGFVVKLNAER